MVASGVEGAGPQPFRVITGGDDCYRFYASTSTSGWQRVGTAAGLGVPVAALLREIGVHPDQLVATVRA